MIEVVVTDQPVHPRAIERIGEAVRRELDAPITLHQVGDAAELAAVVARTPPDAALVLCPGDAPDLAGLLPQAWPRAGRVVRVDVGARRRDETPGLAAHIQGRGVDGLLWALRSAVHHERRAFRTSAYGSHADQFGELLLPEPAVAAPAPVAVLVHGGYWHDRWQLDLMDGLADDLSAHGVAAWNIEYRRPDVHGWAATTSDVRAAVAHLRALAAQYSIDCERVVLLGHSAGGQLVTRACADLAHGAEPDPGRDPGRETGIGGTPAGVRPVGCVSLAGVMDMVEAARRELGERAAPTALGTEPEQDLPTYLAASPIHRVPIGVPTLVVTADADNPDLNEMSWRYLDRARGTGDRAEGIHGEGNHFTLIDPASRLWERTRQATLALLGVPAG